MHCNSFLHSTINFTKASFSPDQLLLTRWAESLNGNYLRTTSNEDSRVTFAAFSSPKSRERKANEKVASAGGRRRKRSRCRRPQSSTRSRAEKVRRDSAACAKKYDKNTFLIQLLFFLLKLAFFSLASSLSQFNRKPRHEVKLLNQWEKHRKISLARQLFLSLVE